MRGDGRDSARSIWSTKHLGSALTVDTVSVLSCKIIILSSLNEENPTTMKLGSSRKTLKDRQKVSFHFILEVSKFPFLSLYLNTLRLPNWSHYKIEQVTCKAITLKLWVLYGKKNSSDRRGEKFENRARIGKSMPARWCSEDRPEKRITEMMVIGSDLRNM
ncbi:hypothetical protein RRG08_029346 [Elysia crispata]|uniref:Uncharacterized protein n=1 Tax=Elysia crispata TaxID=231223 RepID=A0AAE1AS63_9GAST|nr:hypothetical protein RRG08_029346 [Elysia crispata]